MRVEKRVPAIAVAAALLAVQGAAHATLVTYGSESSFLAAVGSLPYESFEGLSARNRGADPVVAALFTVTPNPSLIGIQTAPDTPETGYGAFASDGTHYLYTYRDFQSTNTLLFELSAPVTAFGLYILDFGEDTGTLTLTTDAGDAIVGVTAANIPPAGPTLPSGNQFFFGFAQSTPFTEVTLTSTVYDEAFGIDEVFVGSAPVPAPSALALLLSGALAGGLVNRRRR
jgi:hypothetical protein